MRVCTVCHQSKSLDGYFRNCRAKDGLQKHCKKCHKIMADKWLSENREVKREINRIAMKKYREKHPQKVKKANE